MSEGNNEFELNNQNGDPELENHDDDNQEGEQGNEQNQEAGEGEGEEFAVTVGDENPDEGRGEENTPVIRKLRDNDRKKSKRIQELEKQLASYEQPKKVELGEKPTIQSVGYDEDLLSKKLDEWYAEKAEFDAQEAAEEAKKAQEEQYWQGKLQSYKEKKNTLKAKVKDFEEAEEIARDILNKTQEGILIHAAKNPELIIYHLGKNPAKAKQLAEIKDPIEFAFALAEIDTQIKVQPRKPQTAPERKAGGSASLNGVVDKELEALEKEADRTGDRTKLIRYKKSLKK